MHAAMNHRFFHATMTVATLMMVGISAWGLHGTQLRLVLDSFLPLAGVLVFLLAAAAFYRWRQADKLLNVLLITFWAVAFTGLHALPMYVAARQAFPLQDELFAHIDRTLGVQVTDILRWGEALPWAR